MRLSSVKVVLVPPLWSFVGFYAMFLACGWITSSVTFLGLSEWAQGARFSLVKVVLVHIVPPCLIFVMYLLCHAPCVRLDDTCCKYVHFFRLILGVLWVGTKCLLSLVKVGFSTYSPTLFDLCYLLCPCPSPVAQWYVPRWCCVRPLSSTTFFNLRGYLSGCWVHLSSVKVVLIHTVPPVPSLVLSIPPCGGRWRVSMWACVIKSPFLIILFFFFIRR